MAKKSSDIRDAKGNSIYWWAALSMVPSSREAFAYTRLKRVWFDHTWPCSFNKPDHENHLTATLFENFTLFDYGEWLPDLLRAAALPPCKGLSACRWSYEFACDKKRDGSDKMPDVVIHARDSGGDLLVIIEAKTLGGKLKADEDKPATVLD